MATVGVGQDGPGYDNGALFVTYVSDLPPQEALDAYCAQLADAGFAPAGTDGSWHLFSRGSLVVGVRVPDEGPPATILLRVWSNGGPSSQASGTTVPGSLSGSSAAGSTTGATGSLSPTPTSASTCHDNGNGNCQGTGNQKTDKPTDKPPPPVATTPLVCSTVPTFTYEFTGHGNGARKHELSFYGSYTGQPAPASWSWRFGDGTTATGQNATDRYAEAGTYTVVLTVTNGSCSRTTSQTVVAP
jgi:chitodextrinase